MGTLQFVSIRIQYNREQPGIINEQSSTATMLAQKKPMSLIDWTGEGKLFELNQNHKLHLPEKTRDL